MSTYSSFDFKKGVIPMWQSDLPKKHRQVYKNLCLLSAVFAFSVGLLVGIFIPMTLARPSVTQEPKPLPTPSEIRTIFLNNSFLVKNATQDYPPVSFVRKTKSFKDSFVQDGIYWGQRVERALPEGYDRKNHETWSSYVKRSVAIKLEPGCGRMQNRLVTFQDGSQGCVRYRQNTDQIQGELFSFYLAQILQLPNLAPSTVSVVKLKDSTWRNLGNEIAAAQWNSNRAVVVTKYISNLDSAGIPAIFKPEERHLNKNDVLNMTGGYEEDDALGIQERAANQEERSAIRKGREWSAIQDENFGKQEDPNWSANKRGEWSETERSAPEGASQKSFGFDGNSRRGSRSKEGAGKLRGVRDWTRDDEDRSRDVVERSGNVKDRSRDVEDRSRDVKDWSTDVDYERMLKINRRPSSMDLPGLEKLDPNGILSPSRLGDSSTGVSGGDASGDDHGDIQEDSYQRINGKIGYDNNGGSLHGATNNDEATLDGVINHKTALNGVNKGEASESFKEGAFESVKDGTSGVSKDETLGATKDRAAKEQVDVETSNVGSSNGISKNAVNRDHLINEDKPTVGVPSKGNEGMENPIKNLKSNAQVDEKQPVDDVLKKAKKPMGLWTKQWSSSSSTGSTGLNFKDSNGLHFKDSNGLHSKNSKGLFQSNSDYNGLHSKDSDSIFQSSGSNGLLLNNLVELAQWSDLIVFDYLTANLDRIVNNLYNYQWNANIMDAPAHNLARKVDNNLLVFLDNESGLLHGYRLLKKYEVYHTILLDNLCLFRKRTADVIKRLKKDGNVGALLEEMFERDNGPEVRDVLPTLPEKSVKILNERIEKVYGQILKCEAMFSEHGRT